ncbi:MAG: sigma-70 family RNA polymerase sigma factor [Pirellulales bacterium]
MHPDEGQVPNMRPEGTIPSDCDFDACFDAYRADLLAFLQCRISLRLQRRVDALDLVQETYLVAKPLFETQCLRTGFPARIWLLKTAQQQLVQAYRQHVGAAKRTVNREHHWSDCSSDAIARAIVGQGSTPSQHLRTEELKTKLHQALGELSETDQEILLMRHFEGRAYSEIAELLELEEATLRQRFGRALLRLRDITKRLGLLEHLS